MGDGALNKGGMPQTFPLRGTGTAFFICPCLVAHVTELWIKNAQKNEPRHVHRVGSMAQVNIFDHVEYRFYGKSGWKKGRSYGHIN